jgi:hypothetical protein
MCAKISLDFMLVEILVRFEPGMLVDLFFCFPLVPHAYMHTCVYAHMCVYTHIFP